MTSNCLTPLTREVKRIESCGMYVDLIKTSRGTVRVGSMPDISKFLSLHGFKEEIVVVPKWEGSMAGDNHTGEEFVLWQAQVRGGIRKHYVGSPANVEQMHHNLDKTFSFFFDSNRISIIKKRWLNNWFSRQPAAPVYENGPLKIVVAKDNIILSDHGKTLYDRLEFKPSQSPDTHVEAVLTSVARDSASRQGLEIKAVGTGNGFAGTVSSCIVRFDRQVIWIDPCGYPAHNLARHGVHWDDITHVIITHNHEDHTQGFSACLKRAEHTKIPINLITAPRIFELLKKQFILLCPGFNRLVNFIPLFPGTPLQLGSIQLDCRWNHHFLPYGTLGFRISAGGKMLGFSGDTKLDETINTIINRDELLPQWFASCDLVFHEIDFDNPGSVHTHWKQVEKLQQSISGQILGYHTPFLANAPFPLVQEGKTYYLE
ncbi:MAG: MBL fold metallo-hydrolase [Desulfobacula sp.]|uniref:MBL fold metallo-hydrolase n=1 Tax=Desulfobacula sp. TaxID=2593537 RepID=UPI0025BB9D04|nr:MBL fold metallo-hydrolase [Desulfobacula sp.]MCD4720130.1 MBL fold metallo-hydrolase [Desulfobacula sp.]